MSGLSNLEIRAKIRQLTRVDLSVAQYATLKSIFRSMMEDILIQVKMTTGGDLFYRARANCNKPSVTDEMMAPPANLITQFQRCNGPGAPMFYSSSKRATAILELSVKPGDIVYLGQWIGRERIPISNLFYQNDADLSEYSVSSKQDIIAPFFETIFTRRIDRTFSTDYKLTAALTEVLTSSFLGKNPFNIGDDGLVGLRYPSIAHMEGGYNTVFYPDFAGERLELLHMMELEIIDIKDYTVKSRILDTAFVFDNGNINWTGSAASSPLPLSGNPPGVLLRYDGKAWRVAVNGSVVSDDELHSLLYQ
jgi:hypothetical protein